MRALAFLLTRMRAGIEALEDDIAALSEQITPLIEPWQPALIILDSAISVGGEPLKGSWKTNRR